MATIALTGAQIQKLIDRYDLNIDLEDGVIVASRSNGQNLKAETVAKMVGLKETPGNFREVNGQVRGL